MDEFHEGAMLNPYSYELGRNSGGEILTIEIMQSGKGRTDMNTLNRSSLNSVYFLGHPFSAPAPEHIAVSSHSAIFCAIMHD